MVGHTLLHCNLQSVLFTFLLSFLISVLLVRYKMFSYSYQSAGLHVKVCFTQLQYLCPHHSLTSVTAPPEEDGCCARTSVQLHVIDGCPSSSVRNTSIYLLLIFFFSSSSSSCSSSSYSPTPLSHRDRGMPDTIGAAHHQRSCCN